MKQISQREARRLRNRVAELEKRERDQRRFWGQEFYGIVEIATATWGTNDPVPIAVRTARKLRHAVVVLSHDDGTVRFHALPLP